MRNTFLGIITILILSVFLSGCETRIEQAVGDIVPLAPELTGQWVAAIKLEPEKNFLEVISIDPDGAIVCMDKNGGVKGNLYRYQGGEYFVFMLDEKDNGYIILKVVDKGDKKMTLRALNVEKVKILLSDLNIPEVNKSFSMQEELFLNKYSFGVLMKKHEREIFSEGVEYVLSRPKEGDLKDASAPSSH